MRFTSFNHLITKEEVNTMLSRWTTSIHNINLVLHEVKRLTQKLIRKKEGRGRNPKHNPTEYAQLIILKEFDKKSLRGAEVGLSELVVGERVDHSVIAYWENKPEISKCLKIIISRAGRLLDKLCKPEFTFVDATKFTSWNIKEVEIHVANRIAQGTLYPIGTSFQTSTVKGPVKECLPPGHRIVYADAWYDDNKALGVMFEKGYVPVVCPNKRRSSGYWRKKARKIYNQLVHRMGYRQRGRGESLFGSLTNEFGDRFKACNVGAMQVRILGRIVSYQIKLLIRCGNRTISICMLIVRHALLLLIFLN
jgi:hypothetical protein